MLEITKQYVLDEQQRTVAVQIPIAVYNQIEEILVESWIYQKVLEGTFSSTR